MYRTPPKPDTPYANTPLPESPTTKYIEATASQEETHTQQNNDDTLTPRDPQNSPGTDNLTDEEIMRQIQKLQRLLEKRRKNKPVKRNLYQNLSSDDDDCSLSKTSSDMDTSFCSTASLVTAQINAHTTAPNSGESIARPNSNSGPKHPLSLQGNLDRIELANSQAPLSQNSTARRFPELPTRNRGAPNSSGVPNPTRANIPTTNQTQTAVPSTVSADKIPPIVLRDKTQWSKISTEIKRRGINFSRAQNIADGIRIYPIAEADFRAITKFFSTDKIPYHTYQLPLENLLNVVFRSIPIEIAEKDIYDDLCERGFTPECVIRMRRTRDKAPMPLILVKISKEHKAIFHLKEVVSLETSVETLKSRPVVGQCFRCQKFGHAQSRCTAPKRCVACAGEHDSDVCPRPKAEPATCANCGETHHANYRGCSKFPRIRTQTPRAQRTPPPQGSRNSPGRSNAQALSASHPRPFSNNVQAAAESSQKQQRDRPSASSRVGFSDQGKPATILKKGSRTGGESDEVDRVEALMDVLHSLFVQLERVSVAIKEIFPNKPIRQRS
ncbi:zinc finger associated protein [Popillia japonica]|uniref:Zinc finger associated protein n=1 Tax=Popillia japonica TaxID=7064 RepID=A0AAW1JDK9_POPJA